MTGNASSSNEPRPRAVTAIALADETRTFATIQAMEARTQAAARDPLIIEIAARLATPGRIFAWIQDHVAFLDDRAILNPDTALGTLTQQGEYLIAPGALVRMATPTGDCDDYAMLAAALILAAGLPGETSFVTVAADETRPDEYSHVYVLHAGRALDASHGPWIGWEAETGAVTRFGDRVGWTGKRRVWDAAAARPVRFHGLGSALTDALISEIPNASNTASQLLLRRSTPAGYYTASGPGGTYEGNSSIPPGGLALGSASSFPLSWILIGGAGLVLLSMLKGKR